MTDRTRLHTEYYTLLIVEVLSYLRAPIANLSPKCHFSDEERHGTFSYTALQLDRDVIHCQHHLWETIRVFQSYIEAHFQDGFNTQEIKSFFFKCFIWRANVVCRDDIWNLIFKTFK